MKKLHLLCNAHLDPVWQWRIPEGIGAALSTFRVAAEFCEEFDGFIFNHNEAVLYQWVEEYDPPLFQRIAALIKAGRWNIMGGWYLQPDCNMPSGESIVRQIMTGLRYFEEKFGVRPLTAMNMDSFGHSKGLVQIMEQAGYKTYMFMRPEQAAEGCRTEGLPLSKLPQIFCWEGYNNSKIIGYRLNSPYNTLFGTAAAVIENYAQDIPGENIMRCWGIGDHGGGPSRKDLTEINALIKRKAGECEIVHSTPDMFFDSVDINNLPEYTHDINPIDVGCYTTMHEIKRLNRLLENKLATAEKLSSLCEMLGIFEYPVEKIDSAYKDLLFCQFHDILPGTSVKPVEEDSIRMLSHGVEEAEKVITKAFYGMAQLHHPAEENEIPVFVMNPHPYEITDVFSCEYMLSDQNWSGTFISGTVHSGDTALPSQMEKEQSNFNLDWRKNISFYATLKPMSVNRFDVKLTTLPKNPFEVISLTKEAAYTFKNGYLEIAFDTASGCIERLLYKGKEISAVGMGELLVYEDNCDPWRITGIKLDNLLGKFTLLSETESARLAGSHNKAICPVRIIEDGDVRTCIEVLLGYEHSTAQVVYKFNKFEQSFDIDVSINWAEKDKLVRMNFPFSGKNPSWTGQDMYGTKPLTDEYEMVAQKWVMGTSRERGLAMSVINDSVYGLMIDDEGMKQSLLRSPAYTGHDVSEEKPLLHQDRYYPRSDQGERCIHFTVLAGTDAYLNVQTDINAQYKNELPFAVSYFPGGTNGSDMPKIRVAGARVDTVKKANDNNGYIFRLFNYQDTVQTVLLSAEPLGIHETFTMEPHEIKTMRAVQGKLTEATLLEE